LLFVKTLSSELFSGKKQDLSEMEANILAGVTRECREIEKKGEQPSNTGT
jgi:hypothetical protein